MKFEYISVLFSKDRLIAEVTLNRPKKMNAVSFEMLAELEKCFDQLNKFEHDLRAVIVTAAGKHFTAGIDLVSAA